MWTKERNEEIQALLAKLSSVFEFYDDSDVEKAGKDLIGERRYEALTLLSDGEMRYLHKHLKHYPLQISQNQWIFYPLPLFFKIVDALERGEYLPHYYKLELPERRSFWRRLCFWRKSRKVKMTPINGSGLVYDKESKRG